MKLLVVCSVASALALAGCGSDDASDYLPKAGSPWVRTTDGAQNQMMTAMFMDLANPGSKDIKLISADCSSVAGVTEVHEMVKKDGKMVMQKVENGVVVPKESHLHMKPGGHHIMLMKLKKPIPVGEEVTCTLSFDTGKTIEVKATARKATADDEKYEGEHEH